MCEKFETCGCRRAVSRAYWKLRQREVPDGAAFDAATAVYRAYHPTVPVAEARFTIAEWLDTDA